MALESNETLKPVEKAVKNPRRARPVRGRTPKRPAMQVTTLAPAEAPPIPERAAATIVKPVVLPRAIAPSVERAAKPPVVETVLKPTAIHEADEELTGTGSHRRGRRRRGRRRGRGGERTESTGPLEAKRNGEWVQEEVEGPTPGESTDTSELDHESYRNALESLAGDVGEPDSVEIIEDQARLDDEAHEDEESSDRRGGRGRGPRRSGRSEPARADHRSRLQPLPRPATPARPMRGEDGELEETASPGRKMIVNASSSDECRIAILQDDKLEELFLERQSSRSHVYNIYKGRVVNVEPSIQAAFIDFGLPKNGFLHISDLQPQYFPDGRNEPESVGRKVPRRDRPPIQKCLFRGQEVIVQITKEGVGTKGPTLTTYLSIPGRYLVLMPGMQRLGVSRKIDDEAARRTMRELLAELKLPEDMGFILRTAGMGRTKRELQRDLNYLLRLWKIVAERIRTQRAPCDLYQESDLVIRTVRDVHTGDFSSIIVDDEPTARKIEEFLRIALPRTTSQVVHYTDHEPIFHKFGIEQEIERINSRQVPLPSGGSIVIESTEAMVTIDVNSGRFRELADAEETSYRTNLEAAEEIARQLRLRDLGGLILCDFIDMRFDRHKREVERALRDALKKHKERARILRMSQFGIIEMTRQRQRPSIRRTLYTDCTHCKGSGLVKAAESVSIDAMRLIRMAAHHKDVRRMTLTVSPEVAFHLQNRKRAELAQLEQTSGTVVVVRAQPTYADDQLTYECEDGRGRPVRPTA